LLTTIKEVPLNVGKKIKLGGWVYNKRSSGKILFLQVRDGTGFIQVIVSKEDIKEEVWEQANLLTQESSLYITGIPREDKRSPFGFEIDLEDMEIIQVAQNYPITKKEHGIEFLMDNRHLWLRSKKQQAILNIRFNVIKAIRDFLDNNGFVLIDPPILTPAACEGTTNLFHTKYFEDDAYLTQSGQLYMEAAAMAFRRVYSFGPTFRAEKSKTRRHLIEFWMIEPEMAFVQHEENLRIQENLITYVITQILAKCKDELQQLERDLSVLQRIKAPFKRITYDEAINLLHEKGFKDITWGQDFGAPHEVAIAEEFNEPVFVTHYPTKIKAFYMKPDPKNPDVVLCDDLLAPEGYGEIIGGSQRIDEVELLVERFKEHKLPIDAYNWYLDLRKYGSVPHSGFGIGLERLIAFICKLSHVREAIPFPRMLNRIYP